MRPGRRTVLSAAALLLLACSLACVRVLARKVPAEDHAVKLRASERLAACFDAVRSRKEELGIPIDPEDRNRTGMLGHAYTPITTTIGNPEAKRTSINPNMAAVLADMFRELGLKAGDLIAVNCSGSFPALNLAVICAAEEYGLRTIMMSSFGSSSHGANDPECTYPDMEDHLFRLGLIRIRSDYVSVGGMEDVGKEMPAGIRGEIADRLKGLGYAFLYEEDLKRNVRARYGIYRDAGDVRCFVNVGGNDVSFGDSMVIVHADGGILTSLPEKDASTGLVQLFLRDGIPVIHLLNIKSIAERYGMPVDPVPLPAPGEGGVYMSVSYPKWLALAGMLGCIALLFAARGDRAGKRRASAPRERNEA